MDSLSCKQNRRLIFSNEKIYQDNISKNDLKVKNPALIAYIEGDFKIIIDGNIFIDDEYMCVLELCVQLSNWLKYKENFYYDAISSEDKSILEFISLNETEYLVSSSWNQSKAFTIAKDELFYAANKFIEHIDAQLKILFKINVADFI